MILVFPFGILELSTREKAPYGIENVNNFIGCGVTDKFIVKCKRRWCRSNVQAI